MSTTAQPQALSQTEVVGTGATSAPRQPHAPIPMSRIMRVELIKMFNTRSGFWLMASIGIVSLVATVATILFAPDSELTYEAFSTAIGFPMALILPIIALLSITSEWSQRSGLTTFTLVPKRSRVITAKVAVSVIIGVVAMFVAMAIGAVGNLVGTAIAGVDTTWNIEASELALIVLASVLGMLIGSMLGLLIRNSSGAIVGYFVFNALLPTIFMALGNTQEWFRDMWPWVDFAYAQSALYDGVPSAEQWAHLGVAATIWLVIPMAVGLFLVRKSEIK